MNLMAFITIFNKKGQAVVELAIILPLLALLLLGVFDFSRAIHAKNIIINVSREGANLVSRSSLANQNIMNTLAYTAQPLNLQSNGMIYVTVLNGVNNGNPTIQSQAGWASSNLRNSITSRLGTPANPNATTLASLAVLGLQTGQTANVVEVFYNYQSIFSVGKRMLRSQLYSRSIF
jgi:Flp pilus assembly protein TadG